MRRVVFDDRAAGRFRAEVRSARIRRWSARAKAIACSVGFLVIVAHAAGLDGSFNHSETPSVRVVRAASSHQIDTRESQTMRAIQGGVAASVLAASAVACGADLLVPEQFPTIQSAVAAAVSGDVVSVAPGDCTESVSLQGKAISLISRVPLGATLRAPGNSRAIRCESAESALTSIRGFRFAGIKSHGGGMFVADASPVVTNGAFVGVRNGTGGGLLVTGGNPRVSFCHFQDCIADATGTGFLSGGAIRKTSGTMVIEDCTFIHNFGPGNADAIMNEAGQMSVLRCDFGAHDSEASYLYNGDSGDMLIQDCVFHDDTTASSAICFSWGTRQVRGCTFRNLVTRTAAVASSARHTIVDSCTFENVTSTTLPGSGIARFTSGATFEVGGSSFCGMSPAAMAAPFQDLGGNVFEDVCAVACPADLVADSTVNAADMAIVLNFWGTDRSQFPGVDIDGDGTVGGSDLAAVLNAWGPCPQ